MSARHVLMATALLASWAVLPAQPTAAAAALCTRGDVQAMANSAAAIARKHFNELPGHSEPWPDCQFRLYDDNDDETSPDAPEVPHVFTDRDFILAGVLAFEFRDVLDRPTYDRAAAIESIRSFVPRFYWGPSTSEDSELVEIPLEITPYKGGALPLGNAILVHHYAIFEPGELAPGTYHWRTDWTDPVFGDGTARGTVVIVPA